MRFGDTVKLTDPGLVVSRRHDAWLARNDHPRYSPTAISFAVKALGQSARKRRGTVSASSLGECLRYQQFVYLGMPQLPPDQQSTMRMHNGSMMHLRWQMAGLSEGWLRDAEVPVHSEEFGLRGTMDGLLYDGSILELKSINAHGFGAVKTFGPHRTHLFQMATYMLCTRRTKGVFIYECKDNQEYTEIPVTAGDLDLPEVRLRARNLWEAIKARELIEPLSKCLDREGWQYRYCPFRDRCLGIKDWDDVG